MQRSFEIREITPADYESLKALWLSCFDDEEQVVDNFFNKTVVDENVVAAFDGNMAVGALYIVDSELAVGDRTYSAFYIYAVCTHPLYRKLGIMRACMECMEAIAVERKIDYVFLVPAEKALFSMYEKFGFKTGFTYEEEIVCRKDTVIDNVELLSFRYSEYKMFKKMLAKDFPVVFLGERGYNSFICPVGADITCLYDGKGYAVFEKEDGKVTVHECAGATASLFRKIFEISGARSITIREPAKVDGIPFGMYRAFGDAPELQNAFLGIPYGG